jgi:hypothetical protein
VGFLVASVILCTEYADVDLKFADGAVSIEKIRPGRFDKPTALRRWRGRFTAIVARGKSPIYELQFDFPLLAAAESNDTTPEARALAERLRKGVTSTVTVRVPLSPSADTLVIYDPLTNKEVKAPLGAKAAPPPAR